MVKNSIKAALLALVAIVLCSCAQEKDETNKSIQQRILNAYLNTEEFKKEHPNAQILPSGLVMLGFEQGTGETLDKVEGAYIEYTTTTLSGEHVTTTDENIAKSTGSFSHSNYYGPKLLSIGYKTEYIGLEEVLIGMKKGGKAQFILPPWLSRSENDPSWGNQSSVIYTLELTDVITDILTWEEDTMKAYATIHYPGLDTLSSNFYFKKLIELPEADSLEDGSIAVRYVGRLLDGWVFDTNIADTAKKYGIYDSSKDYEPMEISYNPDEDEMLNANSSVTGFIKALYRMKAGEAAFTMFGSKYGYDYEGSDPIGPYQPLIFWLYIEP